MSFISKSDVILDLTNFTTAVAIGLLRHSFKCIRYYNLKLVIIAWTE